MMVCGVLLAIGVLARVLIELSGVFVCYSSRSKV